MVARVGIISLKYDTTEIEYASKYKLSTIQFVGPSKVAAGSMDEEASKPDETVERALSV